MAAKINRFYSRSEIGLRSPRSISQNIRPDRGGVAVHWGGPPQGTTGASCSCARVWRSWQNYHMNVHGWVDIAYSFGFCNHGNVFAGRGFGVRTAANGTNDGNYRFYAACWIGGLGERPSQAAYNALNWLVRESRTKGNAGNEVRPHSDFTGSSCPGGALRDHARSIHNKNIGDSTSGDIWEELGLSDLSNKEKEALRSFANFLADEDVRGDSFGRQLLQFHREERKTLQDIIQHIKAKGTSTQGFVRGATNLFRHARDEEGWPVDTS